MYHRTKAKVITPDGETRFFEILTGVLQGMLWRPSSLYDSFGLCNETSIIQ